MAEDLNSWERNTINKMLEMSIKEQRAARRWGIFFKLLILAYVLTITVLIVTQKKDFFHTVKQQQFTAVIDIKGILAPDKPASADNIIPLLKEAFENPLSKAVVMRINSPGGSPVQANQIYDEMQRQKLKYPKKKLYAVIEESGASGAYWVACGADLIYADKTSIVGSIGVVLSSFGFVDTMQKLGVERRLYISGDNKGMLDPFSPRKPSQDLMLQKDLDQAHQLFIDLVKAARGDRLKINDEMFSGRFWLGLDAKPLGLIDEFGDIYYLAREVIKAPELVEFSPKESLFSQLGNKFGQSVRETIAEYSLG
jgi:protease-4